MMTDIMDKPYITTTEKETQTRTQMRETDRDGDGVRNGGSCSNRGLTAAEKQPNKGWSSRATEAQTDSRDNRPNVESEDDDADRTPTETEQRPEKR
mgnify:CR=1 FL=1